MNRVLANAIKHWDYIAPLVSRPQNDKEYNTLISRLDELLNIVGDDENHPLIGLVDIISELISAYEKDRFHRHKVKGTKALKLLMEQHGLRQADFAEIASQGVFSEIINGKRPLNLRQIKLLAKRFNVDPETFMDD